tara:strand:+ start:2980 stop:3642 length:663 start_codon:yes stop_codon:yes gene_type:complete
MNSSRFLAFVESLHPWLFEFKRCPHDLGAKRKIDRILRLFENYVEWYISDDMVGELHKLEARANVDGLAALLTDYEGTELVAKVIRKIRGLGKKHNHWNRSTDDNFPCVEHVKPVSDTILEILKVGGALYDKRFYELTFEEKLQACAVLFDIIEGSPICLITRREDKRLPKNRRGKNPWLAYDVPKSGEMIQRSRIRTTTLPSKEILLMECSNMFYRGVV